MIDMDMFGIIMGVLMGGLMAIFVTIYVWFTTRRHMIKEGTWQEYVDNGYNH